MRVKYLAAGHTAQQIPADLRNLASPMAPHYAGSVFLLTSVLLGLFKAEGVAFFSCLISNTYINNAVQREKEEGRQERKGREEEKATWFPGPNWEPLSSNGGSS